MAMRMNKLGRLYHVTTIDWLELVFGYNRRYGTNFKDEKDLYLRLSLPPGKIAKCLGVNIATIYKRMDLHKVKRSHRCSGSNNGRRRINYDPLSQKY